jgi:prepilin-type N-terminal cleavage/methylation domain-containing protein
MQMKKEESMRTKRKTGFTLVELMIVAAIIAILAAILIPLLTSNRDSAVAAEASTLAGVAASEAKVHFARTGNWPALADLPASTIAELDNAKYFDSDNVVIGPRSAAGAYIITITSDADVFSTDAAETLTLNQEGTYGGSMVANDWIGN